MNRGSLAIRVAAIVIACLGGMSAAYGEEAEHRGGAVMQQSIGFDDLAPRGLVLEQCWNAMGMDREERVYIGFTSKRPDGREDFAVFRYDPSTGERRFVGTFMDVSAAAGNLRPGEAIPKGHTRMLELDGKMYMGSQGFHDFKGAIDTLPTYRGSHLYAYDIAAGRMEDISRTLPGGVVTEHQGLVALTRVPGHPLLAGLAHPSSDIVLFDYAQGRVEKIVPGIPWQLGNPLSREIVATKTGKIYTYRGTEDPAQRDEAHSIWEYDLEIGVSTRTPYTATGGFWNGQSGMRDGGTIYLSTVNGELYRLDVAGGVFTHLGHFLPEDAYEAGERIDYLYGITLSPDETKIYGVPRRHGSTESDLYAYDIATRRVTLVGRLDSAIYTGSQMRDSRGNIYFARFGDGDSWERHARLAVLHPAE
jgi:hypothetical protein